MSLSAVELPAERSWVAFLAGTGLYVLRADDSHTWTLLDSCGESLGSFRRSGKKYRPCDEDGPAERRWRELVRAMF
jgi:hypothetical protein